MTLIAQAVREANSEQEIYLLLAAYVKATRLGSEVRSFSQQMIGLPLFRPEDLRRRIEGLFSALTLASKSLDDSSRVVLKEALYIFGEALIRLESLEARAAPPKPAGAAPAASTRCTDQPKLEET